MTNPFSPLTARRTLCGLLLFSLLCGISCCLADDDFFGDSDSDGDSDSTVVMELPKKGEESGGMSFIVLRKPAPEPLRMRVSVKDLQNTLKFCGPGDHRSGARRPDFRGAEAPCEAADIFTHAKKSHLLREVIPAAVKKHTERLKVKRIKEVMKIEPFNTPNCRAFTVPENHSAHGLARVDFALYVAAGPFSLFAVPCLYLENRRPFAGAMNFAPRHISADEQTVRLAAREIAHALGFHYELLHALGLARERESDGKKYLTKKAAHTFAVLREMFRCEKLREVILDDEDGDGDDYLFDRRYAKGEMMVRQIDHTAAYSALSLALFHDLGFFEPVYEKAEENRWATGAACEVLTENCERLDAQTYSDLFCHASDAHKQCTSDYLAIGSCKKSNGCFFVEADADGPCIDTTIGAKRGNKRCVNRKHMSNGKHLDAMCAEISCDAEKGVVMVRFNESSEFQVCPDGETLEKSLHEAVVCPKYSKICPLSS